MRVVLDEPDCGLVLAVVDTGIHSAQHPQVGKRWICEGEGGRVLIRGQLAGNLCVDALRTIQYRFLLLHNAAHESGHIALHQRSICLVRQGNLTVQPQCLRVGDCRSPSGLCDQLHPKDRVLQEAEEIVEAEEEPTAEQKAEEAPAVEQETEEAPAQELETEGASVEEPEAVETEELPAQELETEEAPIVEQEPVEEADKQD